MKKDHVAKQRLDELPTQLEEFVERARAALDQQIKTARKAVDDLNLEKTAAANALTDLQAQLKSAQEQLELTTSEFHKMAALVGLGQDIEKARKELARVKSETAEATKALEKLTKERTEREAQIVALGNEAQRQLAIRLEAEAYVAGIKLKLNQVQIGVRP